MPSILEPKDLNEAKQIIDELKEEINSAKQKRDQDIQQLQDQITILQGSLRARDKKAQSRTSSQVRSDDPEEIKKLQKDKSRLEKDLSLVKKENVELLKKYEKVLKENNEASDQFQIVEKTNRTLQARINKAEEVINIIKEQKVQVVDK